MDIDGHVQLHGRRQQTIVARVIEEAAFGRAVDERTDETKVPNCTNELGNAASALCIGSTANPAKRSG